MSDEAQHDTTLEERKATLDHALYTLRQSSEADHEHRCDVAPKGHMSLRAFCICGYSHMGSCASPLCAAYKEISDELSRREQEHQAEVVELFRKFSVPQPVALCNHTDEMQKVTAKLEAAVEHAKFLVQQRNEAREWAEKTVQEMAVCGRVVTCVYCGQEYGEGTPTSQDERLTAHIEVCEKHPMAKLKEELQEAKDTIRFLAKNVTCDCGHDAGCENEAVDVQYDEYDMRWILCASCLTNCTGSTPSDPAA